MTPVFRFAPSPNGRLHLGHARSALINEEMARDMDGRFLLRIEDIDIGRCRPEFEVAIFEDLAWLGLEWEQPVRRQSLHMDDYRAALDTLVAEKIVYPAFLTRGEVSAHIAERRAEGEKWPRDPDGVPLFPEIDRERSSRERRRLMAQGVAYAWRLDVAAALDHVGAPLAWRESGAGPAGETGIVRADPSAWGDVVIARKDVPTSYHLSVVLDDALQGITHVVRGLDLFHATAVQRLLQELLGLSPPLYHHHTLVLDPDGRKLSKSRNDTAIGALREAGATPSDIRRMAGL